MSTFLKICQDVARESGTVSGTQPTTVTDQVGRLNNIVNWVRDAWEDIQNIHASWLFMRKEFSGSITSGQVRYSGASFGLTDFAEWIKDFDNLSIYKTATGAADENPLLYLRWDDWRQMYDRGSQTANRPTIFSVSPANELVLGPIPDDAYTLRGEYRRMPQLLTANEDIPDMPIRFHKIIQWKALMSLAEYDEAPATYARCIKAYAAIMSDMNRDLLPLIITQEPLA